jgi:four helix bundle protein
MAKAFRDLKVWQLSMDLAMCIYALTSDFPKHELYGLTSQMRRASVSIASNIAEGSARGTKRDFRQFIHIARGSHAELQTQLIMSARLGYCSSEKTNEANTLCEEVGRMLHGLYNYLDAKPPKPAQPPKA